jgi:hypothetical protein
MRCKDNQLMASAYLDKELTANETGEYTAHTASCFTCRRYVEEIKQASLFLKAARTPETPRELRGYVMTAIVRRVHHDISLRQRLIEWMLRLNPRPFSLATGSVATAILFVVLLAGLKPIPVPRGESRLDDVTALMTVPPIISSDAEFNRYNDLPLGTKLEGSEYELPRLNVGSMVSFSHIAWQKKGNEDMSALVEVDPDGHAKLVDVINEPSDPAVIEQLWWSLTTNAFQPAKVEGQPVTTHIVLLMEKMDVGG